MTDSAIEWTDKTWNPVRGCARVSPGCKHCYAEGIAARFSGPGLAYEGLAQFTDRPDGTKEARWAGTAVTIPELLDEPLRWRKPRKVFVNSMSDLFHDDVPDEFIAAVFAVMEACPQHTFQILTKRPERMRAWFEWVERAKNGYWHGRAGVLFDALERVAGAAVVDAWARVIAGTAPAESLGDSSHDPPWPLPNVWLGVSVEDQKHADERIPHLLETPAAVRFLSCEPLLGPVDLEGWGGAAPLAGRPLHWVIVGGESGPGARTCDVSWIRSIVEQCRGAGVACFVKQIGSRPLFSDGVLPGEVWRELDAAGYDADEIEDARTAGRIRLRARKGGDPAEWPAELRVREFPEVRA